jgi:hypothetical protein
MLTPLSILSRDQGKLSARPADEAAYFARFAALPRGTAPQPARASGLRAWLGALLATLRAGRAN